MVHAQFRPERVGLIVAAGRGGWRWCRREHSPRIDRHRLRRRKGLLRSPPVTWHRCIWEDGRRVDDIDDPWWWRKERKEEIHDRVLHILRAAVKQLTRAIFLKTFERTRSSAEDEPVGRLDELLVHLLDLCLLFRPAPGACRRIDGVDVLVVVDQSLDRFRCQLEGDLVLRDHVDVDDIGLDVDQLKVEDAFYQRVVVLAQFRFWCSREHERAEGPDGSSAAESLCQTSKVLRHTVERSLDPVDALERLR